MQDSQKQTAGKHLPAHARRSPNTIWIIVGIQVAAVLLVAAAIAHPCDYAISDELRRWYSDVLRPNVPDAVINPFKLLGKFHVVFLFMFFMVWATGNRRWMWRFSLAAVSSGLFVLLVKLVVARQRPTGPADWQHSLSFPSGDTNIAFVWATALAAEYPALAVPAFLTAAAVALLRVAGGKHYPSDILAGAAIGIAFTCAAISLAGGVPRWFTRITQRTRWGLIMLAVFLLYVAGRGVFEKPWVLILAAVVVPVTLVPVAISKRGAFRMWMHFHRARKRQTGQPRKPAPPASHRPE